MRKIKKTLVTLLIAIFAVTLGAGFATMQNKQIASAETTYTTKDVAMMAYIENVYQPNGNFMLIITLSELDTDKVAEDEAFDTSEFDMPNMFKTLDLYNKVKIGGYTLKELGCEGTWDNAFNVNLHGGVKPQLGFHMHADPTVWNQAVTDGKVVFGVKSNVTISEGTLIPSYAYLKGDHTATVYRAGCDYESTYAKIDYDLMSTGKTEVESVTYVQGHDGTCGYFGVSLVGDDYTSVADLNNLEAHQNHYSQYKTTRYDSTILVNGETGKAREYGLFNLGENGDGYFAFQMYMTEDEMESITIPAGTTFPAIAMTSLRKVNAGSVTIFYQTQTDVTFYKTQDGWVKYEDYKAEKLAEVEKIESELSADDYYAQDFTTLTTAIQTAKTAIGAAEDVKTVESAYITFATALESVPTKAGIVNAAKEDLDAYKSDLFRQAEAEQRASIINTAKTAIDTATTEADVETIVANAKTAIDALKTSAQYADEELAGTKESARTEISNYVNQADYYANELAQVTAAIETGLAGVASATDEASIAGAVDTAKTAIDAVLTKAEVVLGLEAELEDYKADADLYRAEQKAQRDAIVEDAITAIVATNEYSANVAIVAGAKADIDALKTDAELTAEELAAAKTSAKAELDAYKATTGLYRDEEAEERQEIIDSAKANIDDATAIADISSIVADAKADIDALKTDAELDEEEALSSAKESALATINEKKAGLDLTKYSQENVAKINSLYSDAKDEVKAATTIEGAQAAANAFVAAIDAIPTQSATSDKVAPKGGCSGSVAGASGIMALLTLCGVVFVARKKGE